MWFWSYEYPMVKKTKELYVPIGENIKLNLKVKKNDVLHSFYVPAFRIKQDAVPGTTTTTWFNATKKRYFCS